MKKQVLFLGLIILLIGCSETKVDIPQSGNPKWITEGNIKWKRVQNVLYVEGEGILKSGQLDTVWKYWREEVDTLIIGEGITELGTECLCETPLVCVKLPDTLKKIGARVFRSSNLQRIEIPESVTEIGKFAFAGCEELRSIQIPKCVTWIKESAFQGCEKLEQIELPETITRIDKFAFRDCTSLRTLTFPASLTEYNKNAINDCGSLTKIINQSSYEWEIRCSDGDEILTKRPEKDSNTVLFENLKKDRTYTVEYALFDSIDDFEEESLPYQDRQSIVLT